MEGPITKFIHVQQQDTFWPTSTPFKSPDLIELNSDSERNPKPVEPLNYSSSQDEVETEDDGNDAPDTAILKDGVYDVTSHDEESCHLLQTEEDSDNSDSENGHDDFCKSSDSNSSASSNGASSESDNAACGPNPPIPDQISYESFPYTKIWSMTNEQREYYTQQFLQLQPDLHGLISGEVAKPFFEKSRLPLEDLRNIWQLADITEDGFLDLNEFRIAMHFVVVRKHNLPIPSDYYDQYCDSRRNSLIQHAREQEYTKTQRVGSISAGSSQTSTVTNGIGSNGIGPVFDENDSQSVNSLSELSQAGNAIHQIKTMNIPPATVQPLPTASTKRTVSGQSEKLNLRAIQKSSKEEWTTFDNEPVNFSSICDTSGLVAPVPVRLTTPDEGLISNHPNVSGSASKVQQLQLKSIQRPKLSGQHLKSSGTATIAPPPPPRRKTHVRSSSLDLNRLTISSDLQPNISHGPEVSNRSFLSPSHQGGAFSIYRKPPPPKSETIHEPRNDIQDFRQFQRSIESTVDEIRNEVDELRNDNIILTRITMQLLEQLSGLQAKRKYLTFQLHQIISADSTGEEPPLGGNPPNQS